ncbi:N-terminal nucleophile aminohydrolase [Sistotremastrum niveocremeum HHB9708]|uniref:N-terminal nucleophile aminohydrolase n=1 Tax=Sistotremastrum niveocremeum HHB9708 TaxID=1314777 RepID=A0A164NB14_9AGAM|nr:N-terminal nucleophile aminohydrolase [Sistotremastrum niveocremeum HHB9708]
MCRWFSYISNTETCLLEDVLIVPAHALSKQVENHYLPKLLHHDPNDPLHTTKAEIALRNKFFNADGLGVAWYGTTALEFGDADGPRPTLYKIVKQPLLDPNFHSICANTSTRALFAHIRFASGSTAITETNNHPFVLGRWSFMHNGSIAEFQKIKKLMSLEASDKIFEDFVKGTTDSEYLAAIVFSYVAQETGDWGLEEDHDVVLVKKCVERAISKVIEFQKSVLPQRGIPLPLPPNSLNLALTSGTQLLTCRFRNHPTEQPPSLYYSTTAGVVLNRKYPGHPDGKHLESLGKGELKDPEEHGSHLIVASEPSTYDEKHWELIGKNEWVYVGVDMELKKEPMNIVL